MDFDLSEEQRLLKDSVDRLMADRYDFESRRRYAKEPEGWSRELWGAYAELGLLALPFDEAHGGFGGGPVETMTIMEAFGRSLALEPYLATVILGGGLLHHGGREEQKAEYLPQVAAGDLRLAFAHTERQSRYDLFDVAATAQRDGGSFVLDGQKSVVLHGDSADRILVTARVAGSRRDREGIGLFLVDAAAPGLSRRGYPTQDGQRAAEIALDSVRVDAANVIGDPENALPVVERVADIAMAALAAEAIGAMDEMLKLTVDYLKTRRQFGTTIGSFQVLQHRSSEMFIALEQARSMAMFAAMMAQDENVEERRKAIAAAKVQIGRSGRFVGQQAIQLHGGVGMTMEYKVGHLFKRVTMIDTLFGDADHHLSKLAEAGGLMAA
ncbi:acyl-CoA dehydrogenase family protein [Microvirga arsenatis]|uniref:Pimeloyl-CoA dehydrogenase small subunit n=1 Tax=Microvirga arsenatis TaxID=2692265 RepID=A0ABW9YUS5_9HYPH|nr:acyl-CoA dehydrogenase family protein [Microvirga arsenatis]NBJ09589.1 pimeloyl-CoA dehydrogenase small subunit [Microvirga arsenatis]NBJ23552.1 pimeloyl-CoA dehydrogenase small subunit [Microvirga arsenatis]